MELNNDSAAYPATFEVLDERFRACQGDAYLERLATGCRWAEGPVYSPAWRCLIWSDIPNDRLLRWDEPSGRVSIFRQPAGYANGHTLDAEGRLVSCEQGNRRVSRTEHDGRVTPIIDGYNGKRFNSPNDLVVHADGAIWFTDPPYGIDSNYEGVRAESEIGACHVYRWDPATAEVRIVADDFVRPNGLAFSCDEQLLYVADTRRNHIRVFDVVSNSALTNSRVFATCSDGVFDGLRLDDQGRVWAAAGDGLHCFAPDGTRIGKLRVPEPVSNLVFGGLKGNRLFITATSSVYSIVLNVDGAKTGAHGRQ